MKMHVFFKTTAAQKSTDHLIKRGLMAVSNNTYNTHHFLVACGKRLY